MKTRICLAIMVLSIIFSITGCQSEIRSDVELLVKQEADSNVIAAVASDPRTNVYATKLKEFSFDLDLDNEEETFELYTAAGRGDKGELLWDDGQRWLLVAIDGNKYYTLFSEYVQLGDVYFNFSTIGEDKIPNVTVMVTSGCGLKVIDYVFNREKDYYQEEIVFKSNDKNSFFTSIPGY